jgi:hypothetical protein
MQGRLYAEEQRLKQPDGKPRTQTQTFQLKQPDGKPCTWTQTFQLLSAM